MTTIATPLTVLDWKTCTLAERERVLTRGGAAGPLAIQAGLRESIAALSEDVRLRGDEALVDALRRFDGIDVEPGELSVSQAEFDEARGLLSDQVKDAVRVSIAQVRAFSETILSRSTWQREEAGVTVGEVTSPLDSVGLFVPSGKGTFPSVLIQIATPAVVAGVPRIAVIVPPTAGAGGSVDPAVLYAAAELGLTEVYRCNGPAGIAALAHGTRSIPRVDKIVGPGSPAVVAAQLEAQRAGCLIEVGFGPTDSLIISDSSADPGLLAADLINEAEHGSDSSAVLISTDGETLNAVASEVLRQVDELPEPRRGYALASIWVNGGLVKVQSIDEALDVAAQYAPEHLQLAVSEPETLLSKVRNAGTVLLGQWTTFAASSYAIGTPATLPTSGFAKKCSGVTTATYLTKTAVARLDESAFRRLAPTVTALANYEGFPAHAATVTVREPSG